MRKSRSIISFEPHFCFPVFHVDQVNDQLYQDEDQEPIELGELRLLCIEILVYLIKNNDRVVGMNELIGAVLASDGNPRLIREAVKALRAAFGESGGKHFTIRTHRGGYQFIAELVATDFAPPVRPEPIRTVYKSKGGRRQ